MKQINTLTPNALQHLKELIFNEAVTLAPLAFTYSGSDEYPVYIDKVTKQGHTHKCVYVYHTANNYYMYDSVEECKQDYKEMGYQISYDKL
jgi:hypothetical protein|tara:strand:+ start:16965 stop:17237 length:273 start_codon:yes stop_codon:yes gene_type:complete